MSPTMRLLRMCFILLFGAMSMLHGPVMTFSGTHAATPAGHQTVGHSGHDLHHATPDCHDDQAPLAKHAECNAFACFIAVEPPPVVARPPQPVVFAVMAEAAAPALDPVQMAPALPPPRFLS